MPKLMKQILVCMAAVLLIFTGSLVSDRKKLKETVIRFHVVANSNNPDDQQIKMLIRDAVLQSIGQDLEAISDVELARAYLQDNLIKIQELSNIVLKTAGFEETAIVSLGTEAFSARSYETFSLPAGVYEALRIVIGKGAGDNWWCIAFPAMCAPVTSEGFSQVAVEVGLSDQLCQTLQMNPVYSTRFFLLDLIGKAENYFHEN